MANHREAERRAAAFLARRDRGPWLADDERELESWLSESTAHRVAYLRLEATWEETGRLKALAAGLPSRHVPEAGAWRRSPFFERSALRDRCDVTRSREMGGSSPPSHPLRRRLAVAAGLLIAILGSVAYYLIRQPGEDYHTGVGAVTTVPLRDGSTITLNTASEVHVELQPDERHVRLDEGEAFFSVAKDPRRPFVVDAGNKRVIAVGTAFSVRRIGSDIRVAVVDGRVRVEAAPAARDEGPGAVRVQGLMSAPDGPGTAIVSRGDVASVADSGVVVERESPTQVEEGLSWRVGYLTFHETSLADAVAEFNRYDTDQIAVDPSVASIRISGTFRAANHEAFIRVLSDGFAIRASTNGNVTTLSRD